MYLYYINKTRDLIFSKSKYSLFIKPQTLVTCIHIYITHMCVCVFVIHYEVLLHIDICVITTIIRAQNFPLGTKKLTCVITANPDSWQLQFTISITLSFPKLIPFTFHDFEV